MICPHCNKPFLITGSSKAGLLKVIIKKPGLSFSDLHWEARISVKNVAVQVRELESEGIVEIRENKNRLVVFPLKDANVSDGEVTA